MNTTIFIPSREYAEGDLRDKPVISIRNLEVSPGKGRGSLRVGRTGVRARIFDDLRGSYFVVINDTEAGQLVQPGVCSVAYSEPGRAQEAAIEALHARKAEVTR